MSQTVLIRSLLRWQSANLLFHTGIQFGIGAANHELELNQTLTTYQILTSSFSLCSYFLLNSLLYSTPDLLLSFGGLGFFNLMSLGMDMYMVKEKRVPEWYWRVRLGSFGM